MLKKSCAKSFGIVIYMDDSVYKDDPDMNTGIHFPVSKDVVFYNLLKAFYNLGITDKCKLSYAIVAHEHGEKNMKCHMQMLITFDKKIQKKIQPGNFTIDDMIFLYMVQTTKTPAKLRNYCRKEGDFIEFTPEKTIKEILKENRMIDELMDVDDPYDMLLNKEDLTDNQIKTIFKNCQITDYKKDFMSNSKKIYETYNNYIKVDKEIPDFNWKFPEHIYKHIEEHSDDIDTKSIIFIKLYTWFKTYCEPEGYFRRKALFLFSLKGGVGKSYFARNLVPEISICNSPYYVYCRGSLDAGEFSRKDKTAKLVILDDVNYIDKDIEIWKALTVSEPTNIRSPYYNFPWKHSLPCVMLSNNIKTLKYWLEAEDLKTRCVFISLDFYIGPPNTDNIENHTVQSFLTNDVTSKLNADKKVNKCDSF